MDISERQIEEAAQEYIKPFRHTLHLGAEDGVIADFIQGCKWMQNQMESKWVPINNILPKSGQIVLVYASGGRQITSVFHPNFGKKCFYAYNLFNENLSRIEHPTHWMPLPEPPTSSNT